MLKSLLFILSAFAIFTSVNAQNGNIQGTISDENGIYVPGANVIIESLGRGEISNFDGKFTFVDIPEGTYSIKITYKDVEKEITVSQ